MVLRIGNLLTDPAAQSFISLVAADLYLEAEQDTAWLEADEEQKEGALARASRYLAFNFRWNTPLTAAELVHVGRVAAKLASVTRDRNIFAGTESSSVVVSESVRVGPVSESKNYGGRRATDIGGLDLPWLRPMLAGLIKSGSASYLMRG